MTSPLSPVAFSGALPAIVATSVRLTLPEPPSTNRYWRVWRNRAVKSSEATAYIATVAAAVAHQTTIEQHSPAGHDAATRDVSSSTARATPSDRHSATVTSTVTPWLLRGVRLDRERSHISTSRMLDDTASATVDALKGCVFVDDSQVVAVPR